MRIEIIALAIMLQNLQPAMDSDRAQGLATEFVDAAEAYDLDPVLLAAMSFRESSLLLEVENGTRRGSRGEVGLMQIMPNGVAARMTECSDLTDARCNIQTAAAFLSHIRSECGGTWRNWAASYGRRQCTDDSVAERAPDIRRLERIIARMTEAEGETK